LKAGLRTTLKNSLLEQARGIPDSNPKSDPSRKKKKDRAFSVMEKRKIFITEFDMNRLEELLEESWNMNVRDQKYLEGLQNELADCKVIPPDKIPKNVVTMNSSLSVEDLDTGEEMKYTLVFPEEADIREHKISVLAPIGTALLGYGVGDIVEWNVPSGTKRLKIKAIHYQPEAAGDYHI